MNRFPSSAPTIPLLEFQPRGRHLLIRPQAAPDRPFIPLSKIPASHLAWLMSATERFGCRHQRCLAFLLLFAPAAGTWSVDLPPQRCGNHSAIWSPDTIDAAALPSGFFMAGSYQAQLLDHPIPAFSGLHFLQRPSPSGIPQLQVFLRATDAQPILLDPAEVVADDQASLLARSCARLQLA